MAVINNTFGFVFVHVPKSAGTSVTNVLSKLCTVLDIEIGGSAFGEAVQQAYFKRHGLSKHSTAKEIRSVLGEPQWLRLTSFGVVRHPLGRLASAYRFLRKWDSPQNRLHATVNEFKSFSQFVASDLWTEGDGPDRMFRPQVFWLADSTRDELLVDHVCRVESLDSDLHALLKNLGIKNAHLPDVVPRLNTTDVDSESGVSGLTSGLLERVRARYARDFAMFGYSLPEPADAHQDH